MSSAKNTVPPSAKIYTVAGVAGFLSTPTLDKMMSDRKHLVSAEVEKLLVTFRS